MKELTKRIPFAYFVTFTCYGTWLHGAKAEGSIDHRRNVFGTTAPLENPQRKIKEQELMRFEPYLLDDQRRQIVLEAIIKESQHRQWQLFAAHVRTNHVHVVVSADREAEFVMNCFKTYASRLLNQAEIDNTICKRWTRHGSTRYLWKEAHVQAAIDYVLHEQGEPMTMFSSV